MEEVEKMMDRFLPEAEAFAEEDTSPEEAEELRSQIVKAMGEGMEEFAQQIAAGIQVLREGAVANGWSHLVDELFAISDRLSVDDMDSWSREGTVLDFLGFSPESFEQSFQLGSDLLAEGRFEEADQLMQMLSCMDCTVPEVWRQRAMAHIGQDRFEEADAILDFGLALYPKDPTLLLTRSLCKSLMKEEMVSREYLTQALDEFREDPDSMRDYEDRIEFVKEKIDY